MPTLIVVSSTEKMPAFVWEEPFAKIFPHAQMIHLEKIGHALMDENSKRMVRILVGLNSDQPMFN